MAEFLLPLFPLPLVLFPRMNLPLHIFEERYKLMIGECLENRTEFGILLVQDGTLANTGCTATVTQVVRQYEDGRMDIVVRGQRRFEVLQLEEEKPYLRCEAQFFDDEAEEEANEGEPARQRQALELFHEITGKLPARDRNAAEAALDPSDPQLSFQLAARLPADWSFQQSLLPLRSESERLRQVVFYLQELDRYIAKAEQSKAKAGSNGRVR